MIHEAGMHLVQKMSASKKAEFLEALKDLKGGMALHWIRYVDMYLGTPILLCYDVQGGASTRIAWFR